MCQRGGSVTLDMSSRECITHTWAALTQCAGHSNSNMCPLSHVRLYPRDCCPPTHSQYTNRPLIIETFTRMLICVCVCNVVCFIVI